MNAIGDVLAGMVQKSLQNQEPDDYFDDEGFLCCGNCHERKQMDVTIPAVPSIGRDAKTIRVGCLCKCCLLYTSMSIYNLGGYKR